MNVSQGKCVGASADGRHAKEPLNDNVSLVGGRDVHGPTATVKSVAKIDQMKANNGALFHLDNILNFTIVAAYISMLVPLITDFPKIITVIVSALVSTVGSLYLNGKWYIIIACLIASLIGYLFSYTKKVVKEESYESQGGSDG